MMPLTSSKRPGRYRLLTGVLLVMTLLSSCQQRSVVVPQEGTARQLWSYYPWWMREAWKEQGLEGYNRLFFFEYRMQVNGSLSIPKEAAGTWKALRAESRMHGLGLDRTLTLFDAVVFERLFRDRNNRASLLVHATRLSADADGIQLDVELFRPVSPEALHGYREFVAALARELRAQPNRKLLSAFIAKGDATPLYDANTAALFDYVVLQGYDAVWLDSRYSGPVAPVRGPATLTWEKALRSALDLGLRRERIVFSVPFYGYEWPTVSDQPLATTRGRGQQITFAPVDARLLPLIRINARDRIVRHGSRRHRESDAAYYAFLDTDGWWQGWFDDEHSLSRKLDFIRREGLGGMASFAYGYDGGQLLRSIDAELKRGGQTAPRPPDQVIRDGAKR